MANQHESPDPLSELPIGGRTASARAGGSRWARLPQWVRVWRITGAVLTTLLALFSALPGAGCLQFLIGLLFVSWLLPTLLWVVYWLWTHLTYRVGVRLLISYLLVALLPFPLLLTLAGFGAYLLIGQYTSSSLDQLVEGIEERLEELVEDAEPLPRPAALETLREGPRFPNDLPELRGQTAWMLVERGRVVERSPEPPRVRATDAAEGADGAEGDGGEPVRASPEPLPAPSWLESGLESGPFVTPRGPVLAAISRRGERTVAVWLPLGAAASEVVSRDRWFEARFLREAAQIEDQDRGFVFRTDVDSDEDDENGSGSGDLGLDEQGGGLSTALSGEGLWEKRWVFFIRLSPEVRDWRSGEVLEQQSNITLLTTSPREALSHLFRSPYQIGTAIWGMVLGIGSFFLLIYLAVALLAAWLIFQIAWSTSRLTRGARQVEAGELGHRIPSCRRDQLGDLARSFNRMTESVQHMLEEVAEKERLKSELGLAREIQQSLLPARSMTHGGLRVLAHFEPAAEVGGDYFDLFPLEEGRLIVAAGDVAGHGLPTGLLMAMVKSAVATLVREGHRGADLLQRLNRFMLEQPRGHRMVTLALAEIDLGRRSVEITNAAHPPLFLTGENVEEILLPALPVGFAWRREPPSRRLDLGADSRLVFYSDGLVEAVDAEGEQFGFERLQQFLRDHREVVSEELMALLLAELHRHVGERTLDDDLTVLVVDCGVGGAEEPAERDGVPVLPPREDAGPVTSETVRALRDEE